MYPIQLFWYVCRCVQKVVKIVCRRLTMLTVSSDNCEIAQIQCYPKPCSKQLKVSVTLYLPLHYLPRPAPAVNGHLLQTDTFTMHQLLCHVNVRITGGHLPDADSGQGHFRFCP